MAKNIASQIRRILAHQAAPKTHHDHVAENRGCMECPAPTRIGTFWPPISLVMMARSLIINR